MRIEDKYGFFFGNISSEWADADADTIDESSENTLPGKPTAFSSSEHSFVSGELSNENFLHKEVSSSELKGFRKYFKIK